MFLLVLAHAGSPRQRVVKRLLLLLLGCKTVTPCLSIHHGLDLGPGAKCHLDVVRVWQ